MCEPAKRGAHPLKLLDLRIQFGNALARELARAGAIVGRIQRQKLTDLLERETGCLRRADEAKAAGVIGAVAPDAASGASPGRPVWLVQQTATLIVAHRFDADAALARERRDRHAGHALTPYYGTDPI